MVDSEQALPSLELGSSLADLTFEMAQDGLILVDQDGRLKRFNPAAEAITALPLGELATIYEVLGRSCRRHLSRALARGASQFGTDLACGTYIDIQVSLIQRDPFHILLALRDASAQRRALSSEDQMASKMADKRRLEELIAGIAHDFNNLLTPILSNSEMLRERSDLGEDIRQQSDDIYLASSCAAELVESIKMLHHSGNRKSRTHVASAFGECKQLAPSDQLFQLRWSGDISSDLCVRMQPANLNRIVLNLIKNARDACDGAGQCHIHYQAVEIDAQQELVLTVRDDGPGIPRAILHRIFDPYFTTKTRDRGTGLGLAMVRSMLKDAGGSVAVESSSDGTQFSIRLPLTKDKLAETRKGRVKSLAQKRILIVDDDSAVLRAFYRILARAGATVTAETSPQLALERIERGDDFDLVLTDYLMPGMTGLQLAEKIMNYNSALPVVMCSGKMQSEVHAAANRQHTRLILAKPIHSNRLIASLVSVLG